MTLRAGIPQGERYDFCTAIMSIQSGFAEKYFNFPFSHWYPSFLGVQRFNVQRSRSF
jgi:hypothetical protein